MSKYDELSLLCSTTSPDIIALVEIKPKHGSTPDTQMMAIQGYELLVSKLSAPNTRGTCLYIKQALKPQQIDSEFDDSVWASITGTRESKLLVGSIYRSGTPKTAILKDDILHRTLRWASTARSYTHKLILGDFNHPNIQWHPLPSLPGNKAQTSPEYKFLECIRDTYLHQHVRNPTRYRTNQTPTLDDLVLTNQKEMVSNLRHTHPIGNSDHVSIRCTFAMSTNHKTGIRKVTCYDKGNYKELRDVLRKDWTVELHNMTAQDAMDKLQQEITQAAENLIPSRTTGAKRHKPPWMNKDSLKKARRKHHAWIKYLNTKTEQHYQHYLTATEPVSTCIEKSPQVLRDENSQRV